MREIYTKNTRDKGNLGENIACEYLIKIGFSIIKRNYRKKWGEIDIIATKDKKLHFIEVKSVKMSNNQSENEIFSLKSDVFLVDRHRPEENVHPFKIHKIRKMVSVYLEEYCQNREVDFAFHVICVYLNFVSRTAKVKMIENIIL